MNKKSLEFIDRVLAENGITVDKQKTIVKEDAEFDNTILQEANEVIEKAMRTSLRSAILESSIEDSKKLDRIGLIEDAEFTDSQKSKFLYNTIHPIIETSGILQVPKDNIPVFVSGVVYETALALQMAKEGMFEEIALFNEMNDLYSQEEIEEATVEDLKEDIEQILETKESTKKEILESYLERVFSDWNVEDPRQQRLVIDSAKQYIKEGIVENLAIDFDELSELDLLKEEPGAQDTGRTTKEILGSLRQRRIDEKMLMNKQEELRKAQEAINKPGLVPRIKQSLINKTMGIRNAINNLRNKVAPGLKGENLTTGKGIRAAAQWAKRRVGLGNVNLVNKWTVGAGALGAAALAAWAIKKWRDTKDPSKVVASLQSKKSACTTDACRKAADAQISKWKAKVKTA